MARGMGIGIGMEHGHEVYKIELYMKHAHGHEACEIEPYSEPCMEQFHGHAHEGVGGGVMHNQYVIFKLLASQTQVLDLPRV